MTKKIDLNERLTPSQCGCGNAAKEKSDAHPAAAKHDCCSDGAGLNGAAHRHEEGCCGGSHAAGKTHQHGASSSNEEVER